MAEIKEEYKQGIGAYTEALMYIIPVARNMVEMAKTKGMQLDEKTLMASFDVVIQHSLLRASIIDGKIHKEDFDYIKSIGDYGSLPQYYNEKKKSDIAWEQIESYEAPVLKAVLDEIEPEVKVLQNRVTRSLIIAVAHSGTAAPISRLFACVDGIFDNMLKLDGRENLRFKGEDNILAFAMINDVNPRK